MPTGRTSTPGVTRTAGTASNTTIVPLSVALEVALVAGAGEGEDSKPLVTAGEGEDSKPPPAAGEGDAASASRGEAAGEGEAASGSSTGEVARAGEAS